MTPCYYPTTSAEYFEVHEEEHPEFPLEEVSWVSQPLSAQVPRRIRTQKQIEASQARRDLGGY